MFYIQCHSHTDKSNIRLLDCTNQTKELLKTAVDVGYSGLAITDHEVLSAHVEALQTTKEMKEKGEIPEDFKLILGNEIYLVDSIEEVKDNYQSGVTKFPHFILMAKDKEGHRQLRILSSRAWKNSFKTGMMERVPTEKSFIEDVVKDNPGHIIASSACLGSELAQYTLRLKEAEENDDEQSAKDVKRKINTFIKWCINTFGKENFFVEIQPSHQEDQIYANKKQIQIAKHYGLKWIVTSDVHFLRPEDREVHKAYLNSKEGDREVDDFYTSCYAMTTYEMREKLDYLTEEDVNLSMSNTKIIGEMVEDYDIQHDPVIPRVDLGDFQVRHLFKPAYKQYEYLEKMAYSNEEQDRYLVKLMEDGFDAYVDKSRLNKKEFHEILHRLNAELGELWEISASLNQRMSAYYITTKELVDVIWSDGNSLVGPGRGSAAGFYISYLLGITTIDSIRWDLPHWRHLHRSREDLPDIDLDTEGGKRKQILKALRDRFGEMKVLQVATFGTEGSKSALQTACRGLEIDVDTAQYLSGYIPFERGANWSLEDCFYGNEDKNRKPIKAFIREVDEFPNLKNTALKLEGICNKRSIHAGGVLIFNEDYYESNAMMRAPNGVPTSQFNLGDSESLGNVKYDLLTIEGLDKIRATLDLLIEHEEMEWKTNLRETFDYYLHPDVLDYDSQAMWEMIAQGKILDLFQFNTDIGMQAAMKVKPTNILETAVTNSLMRLMSDGDEQPVDTYVRFKSDISLWYKEMRDFGLTEHEIKVLEPYLKDIYGVADTQEVVMQMVMNKNIANFDVSQSNKLRKAIAKKKEKDIENVKQLFFEKGREVGTSDTLLGYVWGVQISRQLGYSFSLLHTLAYSMVALQELNLNYLYDTLYWNTACLTVNSGGIDDHVEGESHANRTTEYGKIASAIGTMRQNGVKVDLPSLNKAGFSFLPDFSNNSIVFGLKGLNGIGDEVVETIISHRPYNSFQDFIDRMYTTSLVKKGQVIQLIKGGCFDSIIDRKEAMNQFINLICEPKEKLTMQNFNMLLENNLTPNDYALHGRLFKFRKHILKSVYETIKKPKDKHLILDDLSTSFFNKHFSDKPIVDYIDGQIIISDNEFKKEYDKKMEKVKQWVIKPETLTLLNKKLYENEWEKYASGTLSKWEMHSLSFYYNEHELAHVNKLKYGISNYNELPEKPIVVDTYMYRGREREEFDTTRLVGTVLDKDKNKNTVTILTDDGVVKIKMYKGAYNHYSKQISEIGDDGKKTIVERSWFQRGNKVLASGFRRGNTFVPKVYKNSIYRHTICLIENIDCEGNLQLKLEREQT